MIYGTRNFVNFTKACDYYKGQGIDELTPAELEIMVRNKIDAGKIELGKPDVPIGNRPAAYRRWHSLCFGGKRSF